MKSNKSNEGIQLTNRTFVVPEKLFRAQSVADTIHRQIGSAKKKQQPKSTSSKHLGQPLPFTPPPSATCCNGWRICEAFQVVRAGCRLYHVTEAAIMGPFGLTTIGNIQALSPRILTVICPSGAPIDGSRCFMAQCDACVRLQGQIPPARYISPRNFLQMWWRFTGCKLDSDKDLRLIRRAQRNTPSIWASRWDDEVCLLPVGIDETLVALVSGWTLRLG